ncbi:ABC transporter ATP-binding protein [Niabella hibiscisoli]|uniref:ABC transporter ATP-binding protein n=1 Tax=Niabella hibiscisoli TaxID=1825928 RepID=UPI001F112D23|nr:ABC transporter ATP-binding protein [Niabella hibiscisoli]MCH5715068.1 ABC transporter ATP-binding protein/permease [Niabella hibiscisoli]
MFLDIPVSPKVGNQNPFPIHHSGLKIDNLYFQYNSTGRPILQDISLQCQPGQIIAIVGENGSGKSTLIKLLAKLYEAEQGSILFDNTPLRDIPEDAYKDRTVFLFQDFEKYFFTIEENIVMGEQGPTKTMENIEAAARSAGAETVISRLPQGYQTRMGRIFEGSAQLSGGEWQKIALARVFYRKDAELIVLDEPTSALDAPAEYEIFKQIKAIAKNKMVILITHRLYNLKIADHLYVMQEGRIAEEGSFDELINKKGVFAELYNMQQL